MLRDLVLTRMGRYNDEATVAEARKRFAQHVNGTKALPADLRGPVSVLVFLVHTVVHQKKKKKRELPPSTKATTNPQVYLTHDTVLQNFFEEWYG